MKTKSAKFILGIFISTLFLLVPTTHAQTNCEATKALFDNCAPGPIDILKSGNGWKCGLLVGAGRDVTGADMTEAMSCQTQIYSEANTMVQKMGMTPSGSLNAECSGGEPAQCSSLTNSATAFTGGNMAGSNYLLNGNNSLLGLVYSAGNYMAYEDGMTNLAYYWNDTIEDIPVVNKAFAQTLDYRQPFVSSVLSAWKITRNLAFGLISIVFLYIGVLIIMRKKVNQQTVVTIQYSLPKIAMSMFLIYFSYPIGAFLASIGWSLYNSGPNIVKSLQTFTVSSDPTLNIAAWGGVVLGSLIVLLIGIIAQFAIGLVLLLVIIILIALMHAFIYIKAFFVYMKLVFRIITAPLEFAFHAVPGNEAKLSEWFMSMLAGVVSLLAMGMGVTFVNMIIMEIIYDTANNSAQNPFLGGLLGMFFLPIAYIAGLGMVAGLPAKIDAMLIGKKR